MLKLKNLALLAGLVLLISVGGVLAQDTGTIVEVVSANEDFSTLVSLVEAAGLVNTLNGEGPFTVFAPTNEAFAELPQALLDYLAANPDALTAVLTYHVIYGEVPSADVTPMTAASVNGAELTVNVTDAGVAIDQATIVTADIDASNGVIHAIDAVLLPPITLPEVDPLAVFGDVIAAGSSTVYPVTQRMADLFQAEGFAGSVPVDSIGTGAGGERFCSNAEIDIWNASRAAKTEELEACAANNLSATGFFVAIDALAVSVSKENTFLTGLTIEQLKQIYSGEITRWNEIDASYPTEAIRLFSPGSDSGTYDYFVEAVLHNDEALIQNNTGIQYSEDDNVLVTGVLGSPYAIGYFGFAYYQENRDTLRAIPVEGVIPTEETGTSGEYPLSRPLFIYTDGGIMQAKPQVAAFVNFYLTNVASELGTGADQVGYIPTNAFITNTDRWVWYALTNTPLSD